MDRLRLDIRLALRGFRASPAFCGTAIGVLALGIGMSVAIFTVFRTVLIRKLPVVDQDRVAVMWTYREPSTDFALDPRELGDLRRSSRTMTDIAGVAHWGAAPGAIRDGDRALNLNNAYVTGNFFDVLGARAVVGRLLRSGDDDATDSPRMGPSVSRSLVLSYHAWKGVFGGDSAVVGRHLADGLTGWTYTIVGVAPPGLDYPANTDVWIPIVGGWQSYTSVFVVGRLARTSSLAAARDEYLAISNRAAPLLRAVGAHAETFTSAVVGNVKPIVALLTAAATLLLLIACINVGNLLLLRASGRARELAVRRALGATYGDVVQQLFVEAVLLAAGGGAAGLLVAAALVRAVPLIAPRNVPRLDEIRLAGAPVAGAIAVSALAVLIFGLMPALVAARDNLASPLRLDARSGRETRRRRIARQTLVASQVALAMVMLGGSTLLMRSLERLEGQDPGYVSDHLAILDVTWDIARDSTAPALAKLAHRLELRLEQVPGVTAATPLVLQPLMGTGVWQIRVEKAEQHGTEWQSNPTLPADIVGAGFFKTFGVRLVAGREFTDHDDASAPLVLIVSESFARRMWPGEDAIGKRVRLPAAQESNIVGANGWRTVVGVAHDARLRNVRETTPIVYFPIGQGYWQGSFAVRSPAPLATLLPALRAATRDADPGLTLWNARTMGELLDRPLAEPRVSALLMSTFGLVALLLASIGLYGVMSSLVREQTREIGIRIALGATASVVRRAVLARAAIVTVSGAAIGLVVVLATSHLLGALLYDVSATDPLSLGVACAVLLGIGAVAAYLPAHRATKIDPARALREGE
jgi:putative ABC transport system permease protein